MVQLQPTPPDTPNSLSMWRRTDAVQTASEQVKSFANLGVNSMPNPWKY